MRDLTKYIGLPYEEFDCLDVVRSFYKDFFNVEIKHFYEVDRPSRKETEALLSSNLGEFEKVDEPEFGDLVVINLYGVDCHLGVVLDEGMFLHSTKGIGSHVDRLKRFENLIAGFYRHRESAK